MEKKLLRWSFPTFVCLKNRGNNPFRIGGLVSDEIASCDPGFLGFNYTEIIFSRYSLIVTPVIVAFCDFLLNFGKHTAKNTTKARNVP